GNSVLLFSGVELVLLAILLNANAYRRMMKETKGVSTKGLALSVIAGCLMGLFYKYVAASMYPDFTVPEPGNPGSSPGAFAFSLGIVVSNFVFNSSRMAWACAGEPVSYGQYFRGSFKTHMAGVLGGAIWCFGMSFSIIASDKAGPAISYGLGQGATIVAA